jgi:hypothetical protein
MTLRLPLFLAVAAALLAGPAAAQDLRVQVAEVARSVDFSRGREEFLTVAIDVTSADSGRLRRVQPLRDDFRLSAGKAALPCRWLRGGSLPDDPNRLRFTLGFSMPPAAVKKVSLRVDVPRLEGDDVLEIGLPGLRIGNNAQARSGPGWSLRIEECGEADYTPPALPKGGFISKGGPVDARVFRKGSPNDPAPARAVVLRVRSEQIDLFDETLDVSGELFAGGRAVPLLSASMKRDPSRLVKHAPYRPFLTAEFFFPLSKSRPDGAVIRLHRRQANPRRQPLTFSDLPVPGR